MSKFIKIALYFGACAVVFILLLKGYNGSFSNNQNTKADWETSVYVYFPNNTQASINNDESSYDCTLVFAVERMILNAETLGPGALEALLKGPTQSEIESGFETALNQDILIQSFEVRDRVAYVDFDAAFNEGVAGSCRVQAIRSQVETTLSELPDIDSVVISVNGETEGVLEP